MGYGVWGMGYGVWDMRYGVWGMGIKTHRDLDVWKKSRELVKHVYKLTSAFPDSEKYGLISQVQRASVSVPSNIAEGHARSTKEYMHFISISLGSLAELETQIFLSIDLQFIKESDVKSLLSMINDIEKMLRSLYNSLKKKFP